MKTLKLNLNKNYISLEKRTGIFTIIIFMIFSLMYNQSKADVLGVNGVKIHVFNENNWTIISSATLTMSGYTLAGAGSVTLHPSNGKYYIIIWTNEYTVAGYKSYLATVDPSTGVCTNIGHLGEDYYSLAFNTNDNTLYAMQGDENQLWTNWDRLSVVNINNATTSTIGNYGQGVPAHTIAYNYDDGLIYLWSGDDDLSLTRLQKINPNNGTASDITQTGIQFKCVNGAVYEGGGKFVATGSINNLATGCGLTITSSGVTSYTANAPFGVIYGLAYYTSGSGSSANNIIPFYGSSNGEGFGTTTTGIGDFNGDGFDDFAIGAANHPSAGVGSVRIYYGKSPYPVSQQNPNVTITGIAGEGFAQNSITGDFDLNHDGFKDIVVGACLFDNDRGKVYIFYGRCNFPQNISCTNADVIMTGAQYGDRFGFSSTKAADFDGDCHDDILIGAPWANNSSGLVYIIFGNRNFLRPSLSELPVLKNPNEGTGRSAAGDLFGYSLSYLGSIDGDKYGDIIVGVPVLGSPSGSAVIFHGDPNYIFPSDMIGSEPFDNDFGISVAGIGDINGNGSLDFAIGDWRHPDLGKGKVYVYDGNQLPTGGVYVSPAIYEITGNVSANGDSRFSCSLAGVGDFTGDGYDDFLVGARSFSDGSLSLSSNGREYRFTGGPAGPPKIINTAALITPYILMSGTTNGAQIGYTSAWAGDINGDGRNDELWSGTGVMFSSFASTGAVYLNLSNSPFNYTKINLKALIDGRYNINTNTQIPTKVKVSIYTHTGVITEEKIVTLGQNGDAIDADGTTGIKFNDFKPDPFNNKQYYIAIESMCNAVVKTWSSIPFNMQRGGTYSYDFTTNVNKAYGNNLKQVTGNTWALFNGEIDEDYQVTLTDVIKAFNDATNFESGSCCTRSDITGDGLVDLSDVLHVFLNQFQSTIAPFSCP